MVVVDSLTGKSSSALEELGDHPGKYSHGFSEIIELNGRKINGATKAMSQINQPLRC
mgnify:FL=1